MEVSSKTLEGLSIVGNSVFIPDSCFNYVLDTFYKILVDSDFNPRLEGK